MVPRQVEALMVVVIVLVALALTPVSSQIIFPAIGCSDSHVRCPELAAKGACNTDRTYMRNVCQVSCNLCSPTTTTTTTTTAIPTTTTTTTDTASTSYQTNPSTASPKIETTIVPRRSIANPDFDCGGPPSPAHSRTTRQATGEEQQQEVFQDPPFAVFSGEDGVQPLSHASCGASPISDRFLLTAAYCVLDPANPVTSVRLGDIDLAQENENNSRPADYSIIGIYTPDTFVKGVRYDDIALLKTDRKIEFSEFVFPYCVSASPPAVDTDVIAAGFGFVNETHKSTHLMEGLLRVLPLAQCQERYLQQEEQRVREAYPSLLVGNRGLLCAGDEVSGVCMGDEGGPLFREDEKGRRFLEGIISFTGSFCGEGVLPGVFTSVADYVDFIDKTIYGEEQP